MSTWLFRHWRLLFHFALTLRTLAVDAGDLKVLFFQNTLQSNVSTSLRSAKTLKKKALILHCFCPNVALHGFLVYGSGTRHAQRHQ